jgi:hypothetical protein
VRCSRGEFVIDNFARLDNTDRDDGIIMDNMANDETEFRRTEPSRWFNWTFAAVVVLLNIFPLQGAWQDKSWGALWFALIGAPLLNLVLAFVGVAASAILASMRPQFSVGRHLAVCLGVPAAAVVVDLLVIFSMDLHGC